MTGRTSRLPSWILALVLSFHGITAQYYNYSAYQQPQPDYSGYAQQAAYPTQQPYTTAPPPPPPAPGAEEVCKPRSHDDMKAAVEASRFVYNEEVRVGDLIPGTEFKVLRVLNPVFEKTPLRVVVAESDPAMLIAFRGTKTNKCACWDKFRDRLKVADALPRLRKNNHTKECDSWGLIQERTKQLLKQLKSSMSPRDKSIKYKNRPLKVMNYFKKALDVFKPATLIPGGVQRGRKYIITGHSLGGALASLYSITERLAKTGLFEHPDSSLITFGQPRVGNKEFAKVHDQLIKPWRKLRVVLREDGVPSVPKIGYYHHSTKVWLSLGAVGKETFVTLCDVGDDPDGCHSKKKPRMSVKHHAVTAYRDAIFDNTERFFDKNIKPRVTFEESQCVEG